MAYDPLSGVSRDGIRSKLPRFNQQELLVLVLALIFGFVFCVLIAFPLNTILSEDDIWVGFIEEPVKIIAVVGLALAFPVAFLSKTKRVIYGVAAGLGFMFMENVLYYYIKIPNEAEEYLQIYYAALISQLGWSKQQAYQYVTQHSAELKHDFMVQALIGRIEFGFTAHIVWTAIAAVGLIYIVVNRSEWWKSVSFIALAALLHGMFDYSAGADDQTGMIIVSVVSVGILLAAWRFIPETGIPGRFVGILQVPPNNEILVTDNRIFGRDDFAEYVPFDEARRISRDQFRISRWEEKFFIEDLGGSARILVNGTKIQPNTRVPLPIGSKITLPNGTNLTFFTKGAEQYMSPVTTTDVPRTEAQSRARTEADAVQQFDAPSRLDKPIRVDAPPDRTRTLAQLTQQGEVTRALLAKLIGPGNVEIPLTGSKTFGRDDFKNMVDPDKLPFISRRQFSITVSGGTYHIDDLHSSNGTTLNGERLQPASPRELKSGDDIGCADVLHLKFQV